MRKTVPVLASEAPQQLTNLAGQPSLHGFNQIGNPLRCFVSTEKMGDLVALLKVSLQAHGGEPVEGTLDEQSIVHAEGLVVDALRHLHLGRAHLQELSCLQGSRVDLIVRSTEPAIGADEDLAATNDRSADLVRYVVGLHRSIGEKR